MRNLPAAALAAALMLVASPVLAGPIDRMTAAELDAQQAALDREAEQAFIENDRLFREAEEVARRYKVDVTRFRRAHDDLRRERQEALRKGNRLRASVVDVLIARNTTNTLEDILIDIPPGPEQQRYRQRVQQSRASVASKNSLTPSGN